MTNYKEKHDQAKSVVQEWIDKQGHERCWYYPELFQQLVDLFEITPSLDLALPPRCDFEEGCKRYQHEQYGKNNLV